MNNKRKAKYYIYRNLHKKCFSIKYKNKVIDYSEVLIAENVVFKVNKKGREKVLKEKRKNVHAYIVAEKYLKLDNRKEILPGYLLDKEIYYNPYLTENFIIKNDDKPIYKTKKVILIDNKVFLVE